MKTYQEVKYPDANGNIGIFSKTEDIMELEKITGYDLSFLFNVRSSFVWDLAAQDDNTIKSILNIWNSENFDINMMYVAQNALYTQIDFWHNGFIVKSIFNR